MDIIKSIFASNKKHHYHIGIIILLVFVDLDLFKWGATFTLFDITIGDIISAIVWWFVCMLIFWRPDK